MVSYICDHGLGMNMKVILIVENMMLVWLGRNCTIVS